MKKRFLIVGAAVALGGIGATFATANVTNAASASGTKHGIVRRIDGARAHAKLNQAERDGVITAAQKTAFLNEVKALRQERKSALSSSSTQAERQAERDKLKSELQSWATTNNFPLAKIFPKLAA